MSARSVPPSSYNLLELYRQHRDEIDAITDPTSLFILAFTNRQNGVRLDELAGDLGFSPTALRAKIAPLVRAQLASEATNQLMVTPLGKRVLDELGFAVPPAPTDLPERGEPPRKPPQPPTTTGVPGWLWGIIAFFATAAVVLVGAIIIGAAILPDIFNPPIPTPIPFPTATPVPPRPEVQIEFVADRTRLELGECTILRWQVVGGFGVTLNNQPVNRAGETRVCPRESTTYELAVDAGDSMKRNAIVISVAPIAAPEPTRTFTPTPSRILTPTPTLTRTFTPTPTRTPTPLVLLDFVREAPKAFWQSGFGALPFGGSPTDTRGAALYEQNALLEDGSRPSLVLLTHPQWIANGYIRGAYPQRIKIQKGDRLRVVVGFLSQPEPMGDVTFTIRYRIPGIEFSDQKVSIPHTYTKRLVEQVFDLSKSADATLEFDLEVTAAPLAGKYFPVWVIAQVERP